MPHERRMPVDVGFAPRTAMVGEGALWAAPVATTLKVPVLTVEVI